MKQTQDEDSNDQPHLPRKSLNKEATVEHAVGESCYCHLLLSSTIIFFLWLKLDNIELEFVSIRSEGASIKVTAKAPPRAALNSVIRGLINVKLNISDHESLLEIKYEDTPIWQGNAGLIDDLDLVGFWAPKKKTKGDGIALPKPTSKRYFQENETSSCSSSTTAINSPVRSPACHRVKQFEQQDEQEEDNQQN